MGRDASWKERLVGERGHGSHYLDARVLSKEFPLSFILIETPIHPDVYYIHIYAQRTPHKGKNGYTVVQFPYRVTHASRTMQKKNTSTGMAPRLSLPTSDSSLCVSLSLFLCLSLSLSIVLFPPLSLYIFPLSPPRSTLFLCSCTVWWEDGRSFWKAVPFAPSGRPAREDGCRLRLINM